MHSEDPSHDAEVLRQAYYPNDFPLRVDGQRSKRLDNIQQVQNLGQKLGYDFTDPEFEPTSQNYRDYVEASNKSLVFQFKAISEALQQQTAVESALEKTGYYEHLKSINQDATGKILFFIEPLLLQNIVINSYLGDQIARQVSVNTTDSSITTSNLFYTKSHIFDVYEGMGGKIVSVYNRNEIEIFGNDFYLPGMRVNLPCQRFVFSDDSKINAVHNIDFIPQESNTHGYYGSRAQIIYPEEAAGKLKVLTLFEENQLLGRFEIYQLENNKTRVGHTSMVIKTSGNNEYVTLSDFILESDSNANILECVEILENLNIYRSEKQVIRTDRKRNRVEVVEYTNYVNGLEIVNDAQKNSFEIKLDGQKHIFKRTDFIQSTHPKDSDVTILSKNLGSHSISIQFSKIKNSMVGKVIIVKNES